MTYYTGIGSRKTPIFVLRKFTFIASQLESMKYTLRSGGAEGADKAFEEGVKGLKEIYLPWKDFNGNPSKLILSNPIPREVEIITQSLYPRWEFVSDPIKRLHARNVYQVLGQDLNRPSSFVVCYTDREDSDIGGTMFTVALARQYDIPVYNFYKYTDEVLFNKKILGKST